MLAGNWVQHDATPSDHDLLSSLAANGSMGLAGVRAIARRLSIAHRIGKIELGHLRPFLAPIVDRKAVIQVVAATECRFRFRLRETSRSKGSRFVTLSACVIAKGEVVSPAS